MKRVLVTGANGALGQAVVSYLRLKTNYQVFTASRSCQDKNGFNFDIRNQSEFSLAIARIRPHLLFHLAAIFSSDFDESYNINVASSQFLLNTIQKSKFPTRTLLVGSAAEYGIVQPEENPIQENHVLRPVSVYGLTKAWQTQLGGFYANQGMDIVIARIFNLQGPGLSESLFVGRLQKQISEVLSGRKRYIEVGSLEASRDYVSVYQASEQILSIAESGETGQVYHVASGVPIKMHDLLIEYLALHNLDISIVRESPELTNRSGYDVPIIYAETTKTKQLMRNWRSCVKN